VARVVIKIERVRQITCSRKKSEPEGDLCPKDRGERKEKKAPKRESPKESCSFDGHPARNVTTENGGGE